MHRRHYDVEFSENFVFQVQTAVLANIHFAPSQYANARFALVSCAYQSNLFSRALFVQSIGDGDGLAMVGERDIFVTRAPRAASAISSMEFLPSLAVVCI